MTKDYFKRVEEEITRMQEEYDKGRRGGQPTQTHTVLQVMYEHWLENPEKLWWWPWELVGKRSRDGVRLSYKASARASDLAIFEPQLVEHRPVGRFKVFRLRIENLNLIKAHLGIK